MRKSERLRQLEMTVVRLEMTVELMALTISNLLESQGLAPMERTDTLESGKWYKRPTDSY
jgi:hypothetical protein